MPPEFHPDTYILYVGNPTEKGLIVGRVRANDSDIGRQRICELFVQNQKTKEHQDTRLRLLFMSSVEMLVQARFH
ncbi:hypothetical protein DPMN_055810 [Dreissena polymorpha]|uniref:Uncharacterized protein n=1 Tax=Dreissena polymorpha TaxID=45954 RepID=A0A9D4CSH4_DREPO|nr:hypothetical protein DPMN_055810 [Dreissena polymorpha]